MPWTLDKTHAQFSNWSSLSEEEKGNWDKFQNWIHHSGLHPAEAASRVGTVAHRARMDYKNLFGDQYQIRLSYNNRATFRVLEGAQVCQVLQVGGHT